MKLNQSARKLGGFSLIELMVVVAIMVVLAGLLIGSLPGIQSRVNRNKVEAFIAELSSGLSRYQIDNGIYPLSEPTGRDASARDLAGIDGATVLYRHLSGDWGLTGEVNFNENEEVYVEKLDYQSNQSAKEPRSISIDGSFMVIDSYGNPIRYLSQPPNLPEDKRLTINPTFDIWSITDADPTDEEQSARHITNWSGN